MPTGDPKTLGDLGVKGSREDEKLVMETNYPPLFSEIKDERRNYKDEAAAQLFLDAGGRQLQNSSAAMARALTKQVEKLEQFHSTPFTKQNVRTIETTLNALRVVQDALHEWHLLIYPNQRGEK